MNNVLELPADVTADLLDDEDENLSVVVLKVDSMSLTLVMDERDHVVVSVLRADR